MKRSSLFVSIILCLALLLSLGATGVFAAEEGQEAAFVKNWGMTLNDEIVLKFEMGEIPAGATEIKATVGGRTYTAPASQQIVSVPVYATQMTEAVTLAAVDADGAAVASRSFTVLTYLQSVLDNALFASYHPLVKELLNYGSAAQLHFIGSSDITVSCAGQTAVPGSVSAYAIDDQSDLMDCTGASLVYREKIALRFYFDVDPTGCTFAVNGEAAALTVNEAGKYVEIADILPQNLDQQVVLSVTDAEGRAVSVTYSPLTYIVRMSQKGSDTTKALVKALYNYHLAAKAFVPLQDFVVSFDLGYNGEAIADRTIAVGDPYGQLPTPADRVGYTFGGWYTDAACSGEAVTAETLVTSSHTLYAKWTMAEDTSLLQPSYTTETAFTNVSRQYIDGVETIVYTTSGKGTPDQGDYQRRLSFTVADTSKEVFKFRFKFVAHNNANGEPIDFTDMWLYAGELRDIYTAGYVIVDANGEPAMDNMQVGQWYTFYGLTKGQSTVSIYPTSMGAGYVDMTIHIQDRELLDYEPGVGLTDYGNSWYGNLAPYQDNEGNWLYHNRSFTGNHHNNTAEYRRTHFVLNGDYQQLSFEFRFNVATYDAVDADPVNKLGFAYLNGVTYFDENGIPVTAANMELGKWYKAVVDLATEGTGWNANWYATMADIAVGSGNVLQVDMDYRNLKGYMADTNPVTITSRDKNNLVTTYLGDGMYNINTLTASAPGTAAWQWAAMVTAPDNTHTHMAVTFRFNAAYAADGVTPIDPTMSIWRGSDAGSGVPAQIYDAETGAMVSSDNGHFKALEIGKWYTVVITNPSGALQTQYRLTPCYKYSGKAMFSIDIADRQVYTAGAITVTTPDSYSNPYTVYSKADGWHYTVFENGSSYNAWQRRTDFGGVAGAQKVAFEVRINSVSGGCTAQFGTTETRREFYDIETGEYLGYDNHVTLEIGKWYKVIAYNGDQGALMGDSFRCYPGNASTDGNVSVSIRNIVATYPDLHEVSFNLNYEGATGAPATIQVAEGGAYGNLPTPTRDGYTFGGWYTDAACSGSAVTASTTVSASHTLYAKWEIPSDTNPVQVGVRDTTNLKMSVDYVNGEHIYTTTTRGVSNPGTGAWQWGTQINVPTGTQYFAVTFRIMEAYAEDGVTKLRPSMSAWQTNLTSGTSAQIYDAETGEVISLDNGSYADGRTDTHTLELGKWYTIVSTAPSANGRHFLFPCQQYTGKALITMEIKGRSCVENVGNGVTVTTPDSYANPYAVYSAEDGWHYSIFENGSSYNAWQRRTDFGGVAGAMAVSFEVRINSISGACTAQFGTTETRREFYDIETGEYLGYDNHVTLEIGKWYKVVAYNGNQGTAMGESFRCYPGNASTEGNVSISFRNFAAYNYYWGTDSGQNAATVSPAFVDGENVFFYTTKVHPINSSEWSRRARLYIANNAGDAISLKVKIESVVDSDGNPYVNTSKAVIDVSGISDEVFTDEEGNVVAATALETGKWYTISWTGTGAADYALWMFTGSPSVHATAYFKDVTVTPAS